MLHEAKNCSAPYVHPLFLICICNWALTDISLFLHVANGCKSTEWNKDGQGKLGFRALARRVERSQPRLLCWMQHQQIFPPWSPLKPEQLRCAASPSCAFLAPPCGAARRPWKDTRRWELWDCYSQGLPTSQKHNMSNPCCKMRPQAVIHSVEVTRNWHCSSGGPMRRGEQSCSGELQEDVKR